MRVRMIDFLTYDDVTIYPGPKLTMVIGPNGERQCVRGTERRARQMPHSPLPLAPLHACCAGSGKSSAVAAICLGLAGKPSTIDRGDEIKDYVKQGTDVATIEIELYKAGTSLSSLSLTHLLSLLSCGAWREV